MQLAEVFCSAALRRRFQAWGALLHELRESLFELEEPGVAHAKISWWAEELSAVGRGQPRHPLTTRLSGPPAPWATLARALLEHDRAPARAADTGEALSLLMPLANSVDAVESRLFDSTHGSGAHSIARHWLLQRLPGGLASEDRARIPMSLLARHALTAADLPTPAAEPLVRDWARELLEPIHRAEHGAALFRRCRDRFDQARLHRIASGKGFSPPPAVSTLWRAWGAARQR